ncbi:ComEC/Rec2-like protein [Bifidobacterium actinocoloniiforme DSM 22766]|uniref:ComEC/Rec2-like protein n=1 Tax=Bifidobacterium actinocoloniiforme DSM 22766 TaxID=1437605 RepID=A0A086Z0A8_9BIFI|nr:ComEC/Rec2 family competence protein [Bifidobacterium actinocoloniiforme]AKV55210.1 hypothetical protein AB656_01915 [Bifidobacterium actinocoloniiforme DSM 22766]KFI39958.1 ComEC/Rec2-like protein [Bifidobacterium actinocoloniiforme DSM 22766]
MNQDDRQPNSEALMDARRERGSQDWRMLPCLLAAWSASLAAQLLFDRWLSPSAAARSQSAAKSQEGASQPVGRYFLALGVTGIVCVVAVALVWVGWRGLQPSRPIRIRRTRGTLVDRLGSLVTLVLLMVVTAAVEGGAGLSSAMVAEGDGAVREALSGPTIITARVRSRSPTMASERLGQECRADVTIEGLDASGLVLGSRAPARLYANGAGCALRQGGVYQVHGELRLAGFGRSRLWLTLPKEEANRSKGSRSPPQAGGALRQLEAPDRLSAGMSAMQDAFLALTRGLDDQGRVLVPGLTLGVLGQESYLFGGGSGDHTVPAYASRLSMNFKRSGIMHLMAVSGSHFLLIASLVRWFLRRMRAPRWFQAVALAAACLSLARAMYPSDSVLRAQAMSLLSALAMGLGRKGQSVAALCWTAMLTLLVHPSMARSFGYALSCAAVLGIATVSGPLADACRDHLPSFLAQPLSVTLSAQAATLPIQVLMSPQLPVLSVLANLIVTPFVDVATLCGLLGLCLAMPCPPLAVVLVRLSSWGTWVMERTATGIGEAGLAVLPWPGGLIGSLAIALTEGALVLLALSAVLLRRRLGLSRDPVMGSNRLEPGPALGGASYRPTAWLRLRSWFHDSWQRLTALSFTKVTRAGPGSPACPPIKRN